MGEFVVGLEHTLYLLKFLLYNLVYTNPFSNCMGCIVTVLHILVRRFHHMLVLVPDYPAFSLLANPHS
jgi:hypothetical protein